MSDKPKLTRRERKVLEKMSAGSWWSVNALRTSYLTVDIFHDDGLVAREWITQLGEQFPVYMITDAGRAALAEASQ